MTAENAALNEDEVYSLIVTGELSKSAALNIIRSYGNRKAMEALTRARETLPEAERLINEAEIETAIMSCIEKLNQLARVSVGVIGGIN